MSFKDTYPDFAAIEHHIKRAHAERSLAVATAIIAAGEAIVRGIKRFGAVMSKGLAEERDRRAIESDSFLKRSVPKY